MNKRFAAALFVITLTVISGIGIAQAADVITGELIDVTGEMYTVKTQSDQGFGGSRATFHVDPGTTKKSGEFKLGMTIQAEIDPNGHAYWVKQVDGAIKPGSQ